MLSNNVINTNYGVLKKKEQCGAGKWKKIYVNSIGTEPIGYLKRLYYIRTNFSEKLTALYSAGFGDQTFPTALGESPGLLFKKNFISGSKNSTSTNP